jgi:hypothetical protein
MKEGIIRSLFPSSRLRISTKAGGNPTHKCCNISGSIRNAASATSDFDRSVVVDTYDIPWISLFDIGPVLSHEDGGIGQGNLLVKAMVNDLHPSSEFPGAG